MWVSINQNEEAKFACESVYSDLLRNFSRPVTNAQKTTTFKPKIKKTVVVHDADKLKGWGNFCIKFAIKLTFRNLEWPKNQKSRRIQKRPYRN